MKAPPDAEYTLFGTGDIGPDRIWNVGKAKGQGVQACYEAVKLDERCEKDYFTYVTRGNENCGCRRSNAVLSIRQNYRADYFKIGGMHKFKNKYANK